MKKFLIIQILMLIPFSLFAEDTGVHDDRITFGAEWNYIASVHRGIHYNFYAEEGYRVNLNHSSFGYFSNGEISLFCGYDLSPDWNISLYAGYTGIYGLSKAIPISLRITKHYKRNGKGDRWFSYIDGGSGICLKCQPQAIAVGKIGAGYRIALSKETSLDLVAAYRISLTHPTVTFDGYEVPSAKINRNNAYVSGISLGISVSF
jgi:hypothetical protein